MRGGSEQNRRFDFGIQSFVVVEFQSFVGISNDGNCGKTLIAKFFECVKRRGRAVRRRDFFLP